MKENTLALLSVVTKGAAFSFMNEKLLMSFVEKLTPREKQVLNIRYGIYGEKPKNLTETAKAMGVSEDYVEMLSAIAINEIRQMYTKTNKRDALISQNLSKDSDIALLGIDVYEYNKLQRKGVRTIAEFINLSVSDLERIFDSSHDIAAIAALRDNIGYPLR